MIAFAHNAQQMPLDLQPAVITRSAATVWAHAFLAPGHYACAAATVSWANWSSLISV